MRSVNATGLSGALSGRGKPQAPEVLTVLRRSDHLTFKGNLRTTRHGWLRLTPAYSVHLVSQLLDELDLSDARVLDPFCGTGTTALVCAERGIYAETTDINPFLVWLAQAKTRAYAAAELRAARAQAAHVSRAARSGKGEGWVPSIHHIEKWWDPATLAALSRAMAKLRELERAEPAPVVDLLKLCFCRTMIAEAHVSFGHQSMSFKPAASPAAQGELPGGGRVAARWDEALSTLLQGASTPVPKTPKVMLCDARELDRGLAPQSYDCAITSPPYPNRMSYIRELRPYMYWLGYLADARGAGELDWQAIGGTWGSATARVGKWSPGALGPVPFAGFEPLIARIAEHSSLLSRYVHKYFQDMVEHCRALSVVMRRGGQIHYIVGNSKFYEVLVPVEQIFVALFEAAGFAELRCTTIRKRTSKKELFEYLVSGRRP